MTIVVVVAVVVAPIRVSLCIDGRLAAELDEDISNRRDGFLRMFRLAGVFFRSFEYYKGVVAVVVVVFIPKPSRVKPANLFASSIKNGLSG